MSDFSQNYLRRRPDGELIREGPFRDRAALFKVEAEDWLSAYRLANILLRAGLPVAWTLRSFGDFPIGSFLVPLQGDGWPFDRPLHHRLEAVKHAAAQFGVRIVEINEVNVPVLPLGVPRIAIYGGGGAPFNYGRVFADCGFISEFVEPQAIRRGTLVEFDLLAIPGGGRQGMKAQLDPLGTEGCEAIASWVRDGGMYLGSCAGAFFPSIVSEHFTSVCPQQLLMQMINVRVWNSEASARIPPLRDSNPGGLTSPGVGVLRAANIRRDHPVMFNMPDEFEIVHYHGPFFIPAPKIVWGGSDPLGLARIVGITDRFTPSEYFLKPSQKGNDDTLTARAIEEEVWTAVVGHLDRGRVVIFGSHPEFGLNITMDAYGIGAMLLANAALWQSAWRPKRELRPPQPGPVAVSFPAALSFVRTLADNVAKRADALSQHSIDPLPSWLHDSAAISIFGVPGREVWRQTIETIPRLLEELLETIAELDEACQSATLALNKEADASTREALLNILGAVQATIFYRVSETWHQDFGFEGLLQHLERCEDLLAKAVDNWSVALPETRFPFEHRDTSPYHHVASSYLAAGGVLANAGHLLKQLVAQVRTVIDVQGLNEILSSGSGRSIKG